MVMSLWAVLVLACAAGLALLLHRHEAILRLQAQVLRARSALESLLRERRMLVETWCALCEERNLLPGHMPLLREALSRLGPASAQPAGMEGEQNLSRLIREAYVLFLELMQDEGPHREFFSSYFQSLTKLEKDMWEAQELYNDSARVYNRHVKGAGGWFFRRWENLEPLPFLPEAPARVPAAGEPAPAP